MHSHSCSCPSSLVRASFQIGGGGSTATATVASSSLSDPVQLELWPILQGFRGSTVGGGQQHPEIGSSRLIVAAEPKKKKMM